MRLILAFLAVAHMRWAGWEMARFHAIQAEADIALDRASAHRRLSQHYADRAGFAAL